MIEPRLLRADTVVFSLLAQPTLQMRIGVRVWAPACVWEQHAVKRAGWMVIQMTASSRCAMRGACVTADR